MIFSKIYTKHLSGGYLGQDGEGEKLGQWNYKSVDQLKFAVQNL